MIVLDTHIFIWLNIEPRKIPKSIFEALVMEKELGLPAISLWEIAMLNSHERIILPRPLLEWIHKAVESPRISILPLTPEIAAQSASLPIHGDPADRLIAATAIEYNSSLATVDRLLVGLPMLKIAA